MKTLPSLLLLCALPCLAGPATSTISLAWAAGDNPTGTQHLVFWGTTSDIYTNLASPLNIPYAQTNCVVSNLVSGVRYYFVVQETDGTDTSVYSNEAQAKTKMNPPKNLTATAP
jgi:hypothetical protein